MALTPSTMLPLNTKAPQFDLPDTITGNQTTYQDIKGKLGTVVMFICNHCPYVIHVNDEIVRLANDYRVIGFGFVAISSNNVEKYPLDSPELMYKSAMDNDYNFPYLYDETQEVAKAFHAACTPDFYLFDSEEYLIYRGQLDDSRPGNGISLTGRSLREAMDAIMGNKKVPVTQKPSMGCGIKWK